MSTVISNAEACVTLYGVSWEAYEALVGDEGTRGGRITYDQGVLEIMSPSNEHEEVKRFLGRMVETLTLELDVPVRSVSSTTFKSEASQRGIEADESYYIQSVPLVEGKADLDLAVDPPPDLAIEVDITRSSMIKLGVYAALGVNEVWRYDGETLQLLVLGADKQFAPATQSPALPQLRFAELPRFLAMRKTDGETKTIRAFRDWVRKEIVGE